MQDNSKKSFSAPTVLYDFMQDNLQKHYTKANDHPIFSIIMCTYNDTSLLNIALNSVISQEFENWELIILDNSDKSDLPWKMICNASNIDSRIHCIRGKENVGWAKGASICLEYTKGQYMTFLAADDFLSNDALNSINTQIEHYNPDIVWVGLNSILSLPN